MALVFLFTFMINFFYGETKKRNTTKRNHKQFVCLFIMNPTDFLYKELNEHEEKTRDFMLTLALFDAFKSEDLDILARHMNYSEIMRGEYLFTEGDQGDYMCFVIRGLLEVLKKSLQGDYRTIARLGKGSTIGEMSIIDKAPRSASVIARQPTVVIILTKKGFDLLTTRYPAVGVTLLKKIMRLLSLNMRRTSSKLADKMPS
jgi:CRP-like cAMP-binding protein